ncbi:MAG: hypothetical protein KBH31_02750 [Methanomassiliicoccales archaeon]|nr:hypothetical protein [Methanomassiliicoccales archaeon]
MLTEDGKAMLTRTVQEYLREHPGNKKEAKRKAIRHFMDYRMAFGGGKVSEKLMKEVEGYIDHVLSF